MNKKKLLIIIIMMNIIYFFFSQNQEVESLIYEKYEESVVYITQTIYLEGKQSKYPEIFNKIEKKYKIKILDEYFTLSSGTGFFITKDGYIVTNHHVVDATELDKIRKGLYSLMINNFFSKIPRSVITLDEYNLLKEDLRNILEYAPFQIRVLVNNADSYTVDLVLSDDKLDVALLKINEGSLFKPIPIGDSDMLKVGNSIMAIGYPVPGSIFYAVKDFKSSMSTGIVSALRSDNWGIQHTSAISQGNSGGPLFNKKGEVIGINVGAVTTGNDLFFSIPINKFKKWIQKSNYAMVIDKNKNEARGIGNQYILDEKNQLEIGKSILINLPEGYEVYLDGHYKGSTPLFLDTMQSGIHTLKITSDREYINQKLLVIKSIEDTLTYEPILNVYTGKLFINSDPFGAEVFIDGKKTGKTPCVINKLSVGKKKIKIVADGYFDKEQLIEIKKGKTKKITYALDKGYRLIFKSKLPDDTKIVVTNENISKTYGLDDSILLKSGHYNLVLYGESFKGKNVDINVEKQDYILNVDIEIIKSKVVFKNLKKNSEVYIDNEDVTNLIVENRIELDYGEHEVKVKSKGFETFKAKIKVDKEDELEVFIKHNKPVEFYRRAAISLLVSGSVTILSGMVFTIVGASLNYQADLDSNQNGYSITSFSSYEEYENFKYLTLAFFAAGLGILSLGIVCDIISIPLFIKGFKRKTHSSLKLQYKNGFLVYLSFKY